MTEMATILKEIGCRRRTRYRGSFRMFELEDMILVISQSY